MLIQKDNATGNPKGLCQQQIREGKTYNNLICKAAHISLAPPDTQLSLPTKSLFKHLPAALETSVVINTNRKIQAIILLRPYL